MSQKAIIAIVDDDEPVCRAMTALMHSMGYHASSFASANEFLESKQINNTSCLVSDVHMPGSTGLDLQAALMARGYRIPTIFITGYSDDATRARAMKAGAIGFFSKPYDPDQLLGCIEQVLKAA